jgi:hypothetical protein
MIEDITVNLEHQVARDPARDFAISIAEVCDTHLAGVAFAYTPEFPGYVMMEIPPDIVAQMIAESEKSAMAAIERFDAAAKRSLISAEHRLLRTLGAEAPTILATLARRFDLSVFMQSEPGRVDNDDMIETALFQSGRPLIVVPYIEKDGLKLDRVCVLLGWQPRGGPRVQRRVAVTDPGEYGRSADRAEREDKQRQQGNSRRRNSDPPRAP